MTRSPDEIKQAVSDAIDKRYEELRADLKNNEARRNALAVQEAGDTISEALQQALDHNDGAPGNNDTRDAAIANAKQAVDDIRTFNPDLAAELDQHIQDLRDQFKRDDTTRLVDRYLSEAEGFHNADKPDTTNRDRMITEAQNQIDFLRRSDPALADELQTKLDAVKEQYAADDIARARAVPQGRTEAVQNFDAAVEEERKRLRAAGQLTEARDLAAKANAVAEALNNAEEAAASGDKAGRDAALDEARAAAEALDSVNPDLAEAARRAIEGNAARYAHADSGPAPGAAPVALGPEDKSMGEFLDLLANNTDMEQLYREISNALYNGNNLAQVNSTLPGNWVVDEDWSTEHSGGSAQSPVRLVAPDGRVAYLKLEGSEEGAMNEKWYADIMRAMGVPGVANVRVKGRAVLAGSVGGDGIQDMGDFAEVFDDNGLEPAWPGLKWGRGGGWFGGGNLTEAWIVRVGLDDVKLGDEDSIILLMLLNALSGNSDRHHGNMRYGWVTDPAHPNGGYGVLLPIDHGRVFHANEGGYVQDHITGTPLAAVMGKVSNGNQLLRLFAERIEKDRASAEDEYTKSLEIIGTAIQQVGLDPDLLNELETRLAWLKSHKTSFINTIVRTFQ